MLRAVTITFDIETETGTVTNVKTQVEGEVKRRTTTTRKKEVVKELEDTVSIVREEGKLVFNNRAMADLKIEAGDRIVIKYEKGDKSLFPVIGTDFAFNEEGSGNKMTKSQTISYKGNQNTVLAEFGDEFTVEEYQDNIWKLVSLGEPKVAETIEEAIEISEKVDPQLLTDDEEVYEIDELTFKL
jgi:hypothetical protein